MTVHELKTWPEPFAAVLSGAKRHEVRKYDRDFAVGDGLYLREWQPCPADPDVCFDLQCKGDGIYTGRELRAHVTHLTPGGSWGLPADLCVMSIVVGRPAPGTGGTTCTASPGDGGKG